MKYFWTKCNFENENIALITEDNVNIQYNQLDDMVEKFRNDFFDDSKKLIFLEATNNINFVVAYIACLRHGNPVLLLDKGLKPDFKTNLVSLYDPNLYISFSLNGNLDVETLSSQVHKLDENLALLLSTSGSTGAPKLVKLSKENIQSNTDAIVEYLHMTSEDRAITLMPLHYSYGLTVLNSHLAINGSTVLTNYSIISREIWALIKDSEITSISGVPFIFEMLDKLRFGRMDLPKINYLTQAGGKLSSELATKFSELCKEKGIPFYIMYGQTEASPRISYLNPNKVAIKTDSIGAAIAGGELSVIDEDGRVITSAGVGGELVYRGPNVMLGYAEELAELDQTTPISELKTGDIAYFDEDGDYFIIGRIKRFIKLFGLRFSLDQIEMHLNKLGYQCVCGGDDEKLKVAVLNLSRNEKAIKKTLASDFKINIKSIVIFEIDEIVRTANGKIDYKNIFK